MANYIEKEVKVLDVDAPLLIENLLKIGAVKVFDDDRVVTTLDFGDKSLSRERRELRLTEEGKLKLSFYRYLENGDHESVKVFVSRKQETLDLLNRLGLKPIAVCQTHRISFEWKGVDFDIDIFPQISPFLEIDLGESGHSLEEVLNMLGLKDKKVVAATTKEVYKMCNLDYFEIFKTQG